jgi:hypothetical protein
MVLFVYRRFTLHPMTGEGFMSYTGAESDRYSTWEVSYGRH